MIVEPALPAAVLEAVRAPFLERGSERIEPPVLQPLTLLLDLAGEAMRARLFVVAGEGGEELCLRPDFTVAVVRAHVAAGRAEARWLYEGRAFRVAPAGSDRPQEFLQIGLEAIGETYAPEADADMAAVAWRAARAGGRDDLELVMGDVSLFDAFARALALPPVVAARLRRSLSSPEALAAGLARAEAPREAEPGRLADLLAHRPEAEAAAVIEELWAMSGVPPVGGRSAGEIARRLATRAAEAETPALAPAEAALVRRFLAIDAVPAAALDALARIARDAGVDLDEPLQDWARRLDAMERLHAPANRLTPAFGRAFDYYDGMLFEVRSRALGPDQPVAAGGRYDRLPQRLGARRPGAVGCIVRPARAWAGR